MRLCYVADVRNDAVGNSFSEQAFSELLALSTAILSTTTAKISPEFFAGQSVGLTNTTLIAILLLLVVIIGFGFRVSQLGAESLSEDELNKLNTVADYRANGITASNGEHPMLMKASQTLSVAAFEKWNSLFPSAQVSVEAALRFPCVFLGALTSILLFLIFAELFGNEIALITAVLWAFDPSAIGFNRIAKEDTFVLFFFLLAFVFWLRAQRKAETSGKPEPLYWATAASLGAMMASKYLPHLLGIIGSYYYVFQGIPQTQWRLGKFKWLIFMFVMGIAFVIFNPPILLPETWKAMRSFAGEKRVAHDSYEFMGQFYGNQMSLWLKGLPPTFYYVFTLVKIPLTTVIAAIVGLCFIFRKKMGDGRYFILLWILFWFIPFSLLGGKFTRYFTVGLPVVLVCSAVGWHTFAKFLSDKLNNKVLYAVLISAALLIPLISSLSVVPHYRLYTNIAAGGSNRTGYYFPHDEFYDASTNEVAQFIAKSAKPNARVANETPALYDYYFKRAGREDLRSVLLSDKNEMNKFETGDVIVIARGRRYIRNDKTIQTITATMTPAQKFSLGNVPSAEVFVLQKAWNVAIE